MWLISRNIFVWTMKNICKDEKGCSVNYFNKCCVLVVGLLALRRSLRFFIGNTYILVLSLSLCMFMLHGCMTLIMETNLFSLPIEELIDSQQIRMSRNGKRRVILFNNSKYMDFPDPEKKTGRVTKVFFSDNRAYVLRCSQIYCFDMNFVQVYLLFVIDL